MVFPAKTYLAPGGNLYTLFSDLAERPHLLIAGATGSGKSVTVNGIIYNLLATRTPYDAQFILVDPKRVELVQYAGLPHVIRYASEPSDIASALQYAVEIMDNRFSSMQAARVREYTGADLYIIIDELADLMNTQKDVALPLLQRLSALGRAAHVHMVACSQNVLATTIPTTIKCNIPTIVGLRTATKAQSRYLVAVGGCELLPDPKREGKGYALIRDGADISRQYIHKYDDIDIDRMISHWTSAACIVA